MFDAEDVADVVIIYQKNIVLLADMENQVK